MKSSEQNNEIDLLDYLNVVIKRRRMILRNSFYAALAMAVISLVLPKTYTATTTLLPPEDSSKSGLQSLLANSPVSFFDLGGLGTSSADLFVEILKSRSVAEGVLQTKYAYKDTLQNLYEIWRMSSRDQAVKKLRGKTTVILNEQGIIQIAVELHHPELAAQVANAYVVELDRVNREKSVSKAKNSRAYIEAQLNVTEANLKKAATELAAYQSQFKALDLQEQTKVAIEKAGELKGTIIAKEVELQLALQIMKPDNPAVVRLQTELNELRKQFEHLQFGPPADLRAGNSVAFEDKKDYFIPFSEVPEVGVRLAELLREVKVQETVWQLLNQQYYSAKIQEARDTPTVQVLDEAKPPERRTKPKRALLALVAGFLTFMFSVFWAFVLEYGERVRERQEEYQKLSRITGEIRADYEKVKDRIVRYTRRFSRH
jgi:uncharacterized protein involved in exopolysaccharide biosynthesis